MKRHFLVQRLEYLSQGRVGGGGEGGRGIGKKNQRFSEVKGLERRFFSSWGTKTRDKSISRGSKAWKNKTDKWERKEETDLYEDFWQIKCWVGIGGATKGKMAH